MPGEEVIALSVAETNELRAKLGLAPLRGVGGDDDSPSPKEEVLELSIEATNDLRATLGLAPLRGGRKEAVHKPAENAGEAKEVQERLERARLEREVQQGISKTFTAGTLGQEQEEADGALSWADKMRKTQPTKKKKKSKKIVAKSYDEQDLEGMNVSHSMSELEAGSTTIVTLADAPLLKTKDETSKKVVGLNEEGVTLENVELADQQKHRDGLRQKRQVELGMGRAGGYAGFDDDEFEELSGTMGPSRMARAGADGQPAGKTTARSKKGFQIGAAALEEEETKKSDLFASYDGKGISLEPTQADVTATDFMTVEEDTAILAKSKKKKKDTKFKKKKKKKEKKHRRKRDTEDDEDEERVAPPTTKGLLDELEATAVETKPNLRKRRRSDSEDESKEPSKGTADPAQKETNHPVAGSEVDELAKKRARFEATMAKGNARTAEAFKVEASTPAAAEIVDDEPDDAFLNAALAKARRMRRLKELSEQKTKGADAVAEALQQQYRTQGSEQQDAKGGMTFAVDDTREFTRALQARAEQAERQQARKAQTVSKKTVAQTKTVTPKAAEVTVETVQDEVMEDAEQDISKLAKEIKDDDGDAGALEGTTANTVSVGRGMSSVLNMLRHTGEITGRNAGKEELRGRAKDERTYEDYEALDLSKVVKIDEKHATDKDKEFAKREIKLEYRDEHGRLLTRKEAYRNLCYQFHGHGSSKKNEEKRLRQIAREQAEGRVASRQVADDTGAPGGSLGALKATQRATGKAFVVHKT